MLIMYIICSDRFASDVFSRLSTISFGMTDTTEVLGTRNTRANWPRQRLTMFIMYH